MAGWGHISKNMVTELSSMTVFTTNHVSSAPTGLFTIDLFTAHKKCLESQMHLECVFTDDSAVLTVHKCI